MDQKERLKYLRKDHLHLTLESFGEKLGVTKSAISNIESGSRALTDQMIRSISREFHISESWLRSGEGEMLTESSKDERLMEWAGDVLRDRDEAFRKRFVTMLSQLPPEGWKWLEWMALKILEEHDQDEAQKKSSAAELDIDQEVEAYRAELEAQRDVQAGSSPSGTGSEIIA